MLGGGYLSILLASNIRSIPLAVLGFIVFIIAPLILFKPLQRRFLRKVVFTFNDKCISVRISNLRTENIEREYQYSYSDIKSCTLSSSSARTSTIKLFFFQSQKFQCSFVSQDDGNNSNVSLILFKTICSFNKNIKLLPPFYASKSGIVALIILTILLITAITVNILYKPSALPFSLFMGVALYIQIIVRRKRDIEAYKQFQETT